MQIWTAGLPQAQRDSKPPRDLSLQQQTHSLPQSTLSLTDTETSNLKNPTETTTLKCHTQYQPICPHQRHCFRVQAANIAPSAAVPPLGFPNRQEAVPTVETRPQHLCHPNHPVLLRLCDSPFQGPSRAALRTPGPPSPAGELAVRQKRFEMMARNRKASPWLGSLLTHPRQPPRCEMLPSGIRDRRGSLHLVLPVRHRGCPQRSSRRTKNRKPHPSGSHISPASRSLSSHPQLDWRTVLVKLAKRLALPHLDQRHP